MCLLSTHLSIDIRVNQEDTQYFKQKTHSLKFQTHSGHNKFQREDTYTRYFKESILLYDDMYDNDTYAKKG